MQVLQGKFLLWHDLFFGLAMSLGVDKKGGVLFSVLKLRGVATLHPLRLLHPITCSNHSLWICRGALLYSQHPRT